MRPRIGVSANLLHADPQRPLYRGKTLQYVEARMMAAIWRAGGMPIMIPPSNDPALIPAFMEDLDGLILSGGADVSPRTYQENPLKEAWEGDAVRDAYEIALVSSALERRLPLLGLCRGIQLLNVALGGNLWQDIPSQVEGALEHRDWSRYDELGHHVRVAAGSWLSGIYDGQTELRVNSVHHQALRRIAPGLEIVAQAPDGLVEAVEGIDEARWCVGLQWHPEWLEHARVTTDPVAAGWTDGDRVFAGFVRVSAARRP